MNKINRTKKYGLIYSLLLVAIFGFGVTTFILPKEASALTASQAAKCKYNAAPVIYSINPNPVKTGSGVIIINVIGNNFVTGSIVRFNDDDRVTAYISPTNLYVSLIGNDTFSAGDNTITVFTPTPGGGVSNTATFRVTNNNPIVSPNTNNNTDTTVNSFGGGTTTNTAPTDTSNTTSMNTSNTTPTKNTTSSNNNNQSTLSANASGGNFAWNALTWILLSALILVVVILWRKYYNIKQKMEGTEIPLKHS